MISWRPQWSSVGRRTSDQLLCYSHCGLTQEQCFQWTSALHNCLPWMSTGHCSRHHGANVERRDTHRVRIMLFNTVPASWLDTTMRNYYYVKICKVIFHNFLATELSKSMRLLKLDFRFILCCLTLQWPEYAAPGGYSWVQKPGTGVRNRTTAQYPHQGPVKVWNCELTWVLVRSNFSACFFL